MKTKVIYWVALLCLIFVVSCSGKKPHYESAMADSVAVTPGGGAAANQDTTKLIKTADMRFKVKNVDRSGEDIATLTSSLNGMVMHHSVSASVRSSTDVPVNADSVMRISSYSTYADMTVQVPSEKMEDFMNRISRMAVFVDSRSMDVQDKTLDYLSAQLKLAGRNQILARQKTGKVNIKNMSDVLALADDQVDKQIDNKRIDREVRYSTIGLSFYQSNTIGREVMAYDEPSHYSLPFFKRLTNAFANGWHIFDETIVGIANMWAFVLLTIAVVFVYRRYKRKPTINTVAAAE